MSTPSDAHGQRQAAVTPDRAGIIDEYGELDRRVREFLPTLKAHEAARKIITSWYATEPGDQSFRAEGTLYAVQVGPRENRRRITDMLAVFKALGKSRFVELASIPLKALESCLTAEALGRFLTSERTGPRDVFPVALAPAAPPPPPSPTPPPPAVAAAAQHPTVSIVCGTCGLRHGGACGPCVEKPKRPTKRAA